MSDNWTKTIEAIRAYMKKVLDNLAMVGIFALLLLYLSILVVGPVLAGWVAWTHWEEIPWRDIISIIPVLTLVLIWAIGSDIGKSFAAVHTRLNDLETTLSEIAELIRPDTEEVLDD